MGIKIKMAIILVYFKVSNVFLLFEVMVFKRVLRLIFGDFELFTYLWIGRHDISDFSKLILEQLHLEFILFEFLVDFVRVLYKIEVSFAFAIVLRLLLNNIFLLNSFQFCSVLSLVRKKILSRVLSLFKHVLVLEELFLLLLVLYFLAVESIADNLILGNLASASDATISESV